MLLQAACIVHLGNVLLKEKKPKFMVKAIYFDISVCNGIESIPSQQECN